VEDYQGRRVGDSKKGWERAVDLAQDLPRAKGITIDLSDVMPHALKHTAITRALQKGASPWDVAGHSDLCLDAADTVTLWDSGSDLPPA
jgi:hypothetical protein